MRRAERELEARRALVERHVREVREIYRDMRAFRHDMRHHAAAMRSLLKAGEYGALDEYLSGLSRELDSPGKRPPSGNVALDAILGAKLARAEALGLRVVLDAAAPERTQVAETDLCVILGNLLDNAIEAASGMPDPFIRIYISPIRGQLYISVHNAAPAPKKIAGRYISARGSGLGLFSVDRAVKKYGGLVNRQSEEGIFATEVFLPL